MWPNAPSASVKLASSSGSVKECRRQPVTVGIRMRIPIVGRRPHLINTELTLASDYGHTAVGASTDEEAITEHSIRTIEVFGPQHLSQALEQLPESEAT